MVCCILSFCVILQCDLLWLSFVMMFFCFGEMGVLRVLANIFACFCVILWWLIVLAVVFIEKILDFLLKSAFFVGKIILFLLKYVYKTYKKTQTKFVIVLHLYMFDKVKEYYLWIQKRKS